MIFVRCASPVGGSPIEWVITHEGKTIVIPVSDSSALQTMARLAQYLAERKAP